MNTEQTSKNIFTYGPKWQKFVCHTLYFMNHVSYDFHLWYTSMYKRIISPGIFHIISKFWFSGSLVGGGWGVGVKGQKMAKNDKTLCPSHSISQEPYIIWCKMMISPANFSIFQNFDFWGFWFSNFWFWGTVDHIIKILIIISTGVFLYIF